MPGHYRVHAAACSLSMCILRSLCGAPIYLHSLYRAQFKKLENTAEKKIQAGVFIFIGNAPSGSRPKIIGNNKPRPKMQKGWRLRQNYIWAKKIAPKRSPSVSSLSVRFQSAAHSAADWIRANCRWFSLRKFLTLALKKVEVFLLRQKGGNFKTTIQEFLNKHFRFVRSYTHLGPQVTSPE